MPDDTTTLQVHLTMENAGTVWHDGVTLVQVVPGQCVGLESQHAASDGGLACWQVPAVVKVFHGRSAAARRCGRPAAVEICAARNEQESLQLAVRSPRELRGVQIQVDPPVGPQGFSSERRPRRGRRLRADRPSDATTTKPRLRLGIARSRPAPVSGDGWAGLWPDPLLPPDARSICRPNLTQPIWITVSVPKDAPAGDYTGRVRLEAAGKTLTPSSRSASTSGTSRCRTRITWRRSTTCGSDRTAACGASRWTRCIRRSSASWPPGGCVPTRSGPRPCSAARTARSRRTSPTSTGRRRCTSTN